MRNRYKVLAEKYAFVEAATWEWPFNNIDSKRTLSVIVRSMLDYLNEIWGIEPNSIKSAKNLYNKFEGLVKADLKDNARDANIDGLDIDEYADSYFNRAATDHLADHSTKHLEKYGVSDEDFRIASSLFIGGERFDEFKQAFNDWKEINTQRQLGSKQANANLDFESTINEKVDNLERIPFEIKATRNMQLIGTSWPDADTITLNVKKGTKFYVNTTIYKPGEYMGFGLVVNNKSVGFLRKLEPGAIVPDNFELHAYRWCKKTGNNWIPVGKEAVRKWREYEKEVQAGSQQAGANLNFETDEHPFIGNFNRLLAPLRKMPGINIFAKELAQEWEIEEEGTDPLDQIVNSISENLYDSLRHEYDDIGEAYLKSDAAAVEHVKEMYQEWKVQRDVAAEIEKGSKEAGANLNF